MTHQENGSGRLQELVAEREKLLKEIGQHSTHGSFQPDSGDEDAETHETEDLANKLGIAQALRERLEEVEKEINEIKGAS